MLQCKSFSMAFFVTFKKEKSVAKWSDCTSHSLKSTLKLQDISAGQGKKNEVPLHMHYIFTLSSKICLASQPTKVILMLEVEQ